MFFLGSVFQMLTNVPVVLVRMVASALILQGGTNARVSEAGIQGGTVMKVSDEATYTSSCPVNMVKSHYRYVES